MSFYYGWRPYVPVWKRRAKAEREMARLRKKGHPVSPVVIEGRTIARTFWGKAWCDNLERYSDFENRLPRGRTYVRNGSVVDLQIAPGEINARVSGSELYKVAVKVTPVPKPRWSSICKDCAGAIDSLVELLQGRFSKGVMERICRQQTGLFPSPAEIQFSCSCPDWASMCKHVAAVLYGIGARLDTQPEFLFKLRKVNETELLARAGRDLALAKKGPAAHKVLAAEAVADVFGLDMAEGVAEPAAALYRRRPAGRPPADVAEPTAASAARRPRAKSAPAPAKQAKEAPAASGRTSRSAKLTKTAKTRGAAAKKSRAAPAHTD
jgi:uncharacterized Zn finger protein